MNLENYKTTNFYKKTATIGIGAVALLSSGCSLAPEPVLPSVVGSFKPVNCENPKVHNLNVSKPMTQVKYDQLLEADKLVYEIGCRTANMIGKNTVQLYFHHSKGVVFNNSSDYSSYDFIWNNTKTGTYGEVTFAVKGNGQPNLSRLTSAMIGGAIGTRQEAVSYDHEDGSWNILTIGNLKKDSLPAIDTQAILTNPDLETLTTMGKESFEAGIISIGRPE